MNNKAVATWKNITRHPQNNDQLFTTLSNFNFSIPPGVVQGFIGEKGSGYITAIRLLLGLVKPDSGSTRLFSEPPNHELAGKIGFCPEHFNSFPAIECRKLLKLFADLKTCQFNLNSNRLQELEIDKLLNMKFCDLSPNQKKRLGLAVALLNNPELLILIEPSTDLAPKFQERLHQIIAERDRTNASTTIIGTSRINLARRLCTHKKQFEET